LTDLPPISPHKITIDEYYDRHSFLTREERERLKRGTKQLRDQLSSLPWYANRAEMSGEIFWVKLHGKTRKALLLLQ
jgi:hypothetical protein